MAEHINQTVEPSMDPLNRLGKPIPAAAREAGYLHCKAMGLDSARAYECVAAVAAQLERDKPYEAQASGMKYLDLTGTYRLFAVLLATPADHGERLRQIERELANAPKTWRADELRLERAALLATLPANELRCGDCLGLVGQAHADNCGIGRGVVTPEQASEFPAQGAQP